MKRQITVDMIVTPRETMRVQAVVWQVQANSFEYYAGWVQDKSLWFITGPANYYSSREGISTHALVDILNSEEVRSVYVTRRDWIRLDT